MFAFAKHVLLLAVRRKFPIGVGGDMNLRHEQDSRFFPEGMVRDVSNRHEKTRARYPGLSQPQHREILNASYRMLEQMQ